MVIDDLIGKKCFKKMGFYSGLIGVIEKNDAMNKYKIVFPSGSEVGFNLLREIEIVGELNDKIKR